MSQTIRPSAFFSTFAFPDGPDVQANSSCLLEVAMTTMKCECIVDSNPPSTVQFMLADRVVPSTELQVRGSITTGTLEAGLRLHTLVTCLANNTQGGASHSIPLDSKASDLSEMEFSTAHVMLSSVKRAAECFSSGQIRCSYSSLPSESACSSFFCSLSVLSYIGELGFKNTVTVYCRE